MPQSKRKQSPRRNGSYASRRTLIIIGGGEDKEGDKLILREIARRVGSGKLVVTTVASSEPEGLFEIYARIFRELGVKEVEKLEITTRGAAGGDLQFLDFFHSELAKNPGVNFEEPLRF